MSIETEIKNLTAVVATLAAAIQGFQGSAASRVAQQPPASVPTPAAPAVVMPVPVAPAPAVAPAMPPLPFAPVPAAAPVAAPAVPTCPLTTSDQMMKYVVESFQQLGPEKGAAIGTLLQQLGARQVTEVKPEQYATLYQGIEQLKAS